MSAGIAALTLAVALTDTPWETAVARGFFVVSIGFGLIAGTGLIGARTQFATAFVVLTLAVAQRLPGQAVSNPPSPNWTRTIADTNQVAEHRFSLAEAAWKNALSNSANTSLLVCAEAVLDQPDAMTVTVATSNGTLTRLIGAEHAYGAHPRPDRGGFYRIPIQRELFDRVEEATVTVSASTTRTPPLRLCGTHSIRPGVDPNASRFFSGTEWVAPPGPTSHTRWLIELRLADKDGRTILAWY
ncbi:MAG: hypothetical protein EXR45_02495 [Chloroflexi bacterium]|nr:hypothetical protein [Chloroflexota bacterium]